MMHKIEFFRFKTKSSWHQFFNSLVFKQTLLLTVAIGCIFLVIFFITRKQAVDLLSESTMDQAAQIGESTINRMDQTFFESMRIAELFASRIGEQKWSDDDLREKMQRILSVAHQNRSEILALAVAYEQGVFGNSNERMLLSIWDKDSIRMITGGNYQNKSWYALTKKENRAQWQEPFIGDFVREPIAIYSVPFYETKPDGMKRFAGVVCVDLSINWMQKLINKAQIPDSGYAFLLSKSGRIVVHPRTEWIFSESIFTIAKKQNSQDLQKIGLKMIAAETGSSQFLAVDGRKLFAYYCPMESTGWSFGILFPEKNLFSRVGRLQNSFLLFGSCGLILLLSIIILVTIRITRPLKQLAVSAAEIGMGRLETHIPTFNRNDELGALTQVFHLMRDSLILQMEHLRKVTAEKEKIESELKVAQDIQKGILPAVLPPFPKCDYFEIAATLTPAKEVGGDLYDFFMLTPTKVCLVIGDVSGKGIPAALFMAVTQTLHRGVAHSGIVDPEYLVAQMNQSLCVNNKAGLFVTYLFSVIDFEAMNMTYTNAGHDPFFILKSSGDLLEPCERHGIPLGIKKNHPYKKSEIKLQVGDMLFFYTDGIPEAKNQNDEFFGLTRLKKCLEACAKQSLSPSEIEVTVQKAVNVFRGDAEQFDDIAIVCIKIISQVQCHTFAYPDPSHL